MTDQPLYHGTRRGFRRGGWLFPATFTGVRSRYADVVEEHVYLTPDRDVAEHFARRAAGRARPRILTVQPLGPLEPDPHLAHLDVESYRCREGARVLAVEILPEETPDA